jgi:hypothetical protein
MNTSPISHKRLQLARGIAICADAIQIFFFPFMIEGIFSPLDDALDVVVAAAMCYLVGFHPAFAPSFLVKGLPIADEVPTWVIAVLFATRGRQVLE